MISILKQKIKNGNRLLLIITSSLCNLIGGGKIVSKGENNIISYRGNYLRKCKISVHGNNNQILIERYGVNQFQNTNIRINGSNNRIFIGKRNTFIHGDLHIEDDNNVIMFKNDNAILGFTHIAVIEGQSVKFGNGCLFSTNVIFRVGDSHSIIDNTTNNRINPSQSILIGDRVWFGNNTTILKGVSIGNDSIVATGAIVTKSFLENNVIIGGNPANVIKTNIKWLGERI